jgi:hypothetical protein
MDDIRDRERIREGHYLGLLFKGQTTNRPDWYILRILGREISNLEYRLDYNTSTSTHATVTVTADWDAVKDTNSDFQLAPSSSRAEYMIHQIFYGISPTETEIYHEHPSGYAIGNLIKSLTVNDAVHNRVGYITGVQSPKDDPSPITELFTMYQAHPMFKAYNPVGVTETITLDFFINKYRYEPITDPAKIKDFISGDRRITTRTMGQVENPMDPPAWLSKLFKGVPKNIKEVSR